MPAYTVGTRKKCSERGCMKQAVVMVKNTRNEDVRECCQRHGDALVARLNNKEGASRG